MILISSVIVSVIVLSDAYTARDRIPLSSVTGLFFGRKRTKKNLKTKITF